MPKRKTHEEFIKEIKLSNPNIKIIGTYINAKTHIKCICNICSHNWSPFPDDLHSGKGCPKCAGKIKRTNGEFLCLINNNIQILSEYKNAHSRIKCKCKVCNYEWSAIAGDLIRGSGCPKCVGVAQKTTKEYKDELKIKNPNLELLSEYISCHDKVHYKCNICGYDNLADAASLLSGHGCKICGIESLKKKQRKTQIKFVSDLNNINNNIVVLGSYINSNSRIKVKCSICGYEWNPYANNLLHGCGCPNCYMSSGEQLINGYLKDNKIEFIKQYKYYDLKGIDNGLLSYDFYLPTYNTLIEYQGIQHEKPIEFFGGEDKFAKQQEHDKRKRKYAKNNDIKLLEIWYWDFNNIEKILNQKLTKPSTK